MSDADMRQVILDIATEQLNSVDVDYMSEEQRNIAADFESTHWERMIDEALLSQPKNENNFMIVNPQQFKHSGHLESQVE